MVRFAGIIFIFYFVSVNPAHAQEDKLILFTKNGCSNCQYAKATLKANNIYFKEYPVEVDSNAQKMLRILAEKHFKEPIVMPVIVYDHALLFPGMESRDTFVYLSLQDVIRKLTSGGDLMKPGEKSLDNTNPDSQNTNNQTGNCEYDEKPVYYLVCGNFKDSVQAEHFVKVMIRENYVKTFIKEWQNLFRVVVAESGDKESLIPIYEKLIQRYRGSYIMQATK